VPHSNFEHLLKNIEELNKAFIDVVERFEQNDDSDIFEEINSTSQLRSKTINKLLSISDELTTEQLVEKKAILEEVMVQDEHFISLFLDKKEEVKNELMTIKKRGKGIQAYKKAT
jgi:predicted  nucleic acid-binding Zn-ribbon protein